MKAKFSKEITVSGNDIDENNHVNNVRYVQWIQDISKEHWEFAATDEMLEKYLWFVVNHNIDYKAASFENETLVVETYIEKCERAYSYRVVEIKKKESGKTAVKSISKWCMIDSKSKRPLRVPDEIKELA